MQTNFALGIEVNLSAPTGRKPFFEERAKRLQRKARPAGKHPKKHKGDSIKARPVRETPKKLI